MGLKDGSKSYARPRQAIIECTVGSSRDIRYKAGGSILEGIIMPPNIMEGRKINWLNRTIIRELGETTPIKPPRVEKVKIVSSKINTNHPQFDGTPALKKGIAVIVMMTDTRMTCTKLLNMGIVIIERAGTPLILKLRNIPSSRDSTTGLGKPSNVPAITVTRIMEAIMVGAKFGLRPVMSNPMRR
jgi:hypothetical protein